ncbi:MAG: acyltransferase family protein, partial [Acidimicrobiales bacterium]
MPALDGLRALAIAGVIAYHLGLSWARGGYLGVDLFFVLSGFLITGLLFEEWTERGRIDLRAFWGRRARRLLPGLLVMLSVVCVAAGAGVLGGVLDLSALRADALATVGYVANWHEISAHQSYFTQFSAPSPLQPTWSLAIEEQFYLVWPPLLLLGLRASSRRALRRALPSSPRPRRARWRRPGVAAAVAGTAASAAWMAWLAHHGAGLNRLYYGTDTRAFDLLAGATLAMVTAARPEPGPRSRRKLHVVAGAAVVLLGVFWSIAGGLAGPPTVMFDGGLLLCAIAGAFVVADARLANPGPLGVVLSAAPLRFIGKISYGLYLWHWPVITQMTAERTGLHGAALDGARLSTMLALASLSYAVVERPLRRIRVAGWPRLARAALVPVAMAGTATVVLLATVPAGLAEASPGPFPAGAGVPGS